jgi:DNA-binding response OmpR family regulator/DNA-binding CsgD family transcriptional regulator
MIPMRPDIPSDQTVVMIVDDTPDNLAMLSSALESAGYAVLVALDGASALERIGRMLPDVILLDAIMPGMDGFETCERIKANPAYRHVPVIFMTALADTEHVVNGFRVGGVDYVTKPIRPDEVVARIAAHVRRAASQRHADLVLELSSRAAIISTSQGDIAWHSTLAPAQLAHFFHAEVDERADLAESEVAVVECAEVTGAIQASYATVLQLPRPLIEWLTRYERAPREENTEASWVLPGGDRLVATIAGAATRGSWIIIFEEHADLRDIASLATRFTLTHREAEVLLWLSRGKANGDIGQILKMMPRTVKKHLERIFVKLGVETRTAAVASALKAVKWSR